MRGFRHALAATLLAGALLSAAPARAQAEGDHPLVKSYPGSQLAAREAEDFRTFRIVTGIDELEFRSIEVEGRLTRLRYASPAGRSVAEIFANYDQALRGAGLSELWRCADAECGPAFAAARWGRFNGTINLGKEAHYLAGSLATAGGQAYVAVAAAPREHQITIVEVKAMEEGLVKVDPDALGEELDIAGHVAIPGIFFETGKADIRPESAEALAAMAKILADRPSLSVWVVGHTDWTGGLALNMELSDARARAVAAALARGHGIAPARMEGRGVGPLSPKASNGTESGRAANRRVELVARP